ncbi:C2 family cysteine protease [Promicromonospora sp. NPDC023805]|uniref:C2 family cysteine protease n=1 Tax=Promicromonospora sp. NPDC023805 TaxID=3154696 RepID=UPI0033E36594
MSGNMYGADIEALRQLGQVFDEAAAQLSAARRLVESGVDAADWWGPSGEMFRGEWSGQHAPGLTAVETDLARVGDVLRRNADDQERTSQNLDGGGAVGGPGLPGSSSGGGGDYSGEDRPGNPELGDHGTYKPATNIPMDDNAIDPDQLNQQGLGDCWLLAAMGSIAQNDPEFFREHMVKNPDGTWTVTMYKDGEPVEITVEPEVASGGVMDPKGNPSWASIYEKAAAEYWGGEYEDLDGGYSDKAFEAITGKESNSSGEGSLEDVREALKNGPVAGGTEDDGSFLWWDGEMDDNRVVPNHAYVVDEVRENANGELEVHVINPWGPGDHNQSDGSNKVGDMWLTQQQWEENFDTLYTTPSTK